MSTREDYPAGVPCWVDTNQPDPPAAARFYSGLFGWQTEDAMPPDAGAHYYMARIGGRDVAAISSQPSGGPPQAVWNTYIRVESADDAAALVRQAGGRVLSEPFDVFDAGRMGVFADPARLGMLSAERLGGNAPLAESGWPGGDQPAAANGRLELW